MVTALDWSEIAMLDYDDRALLAAGEFIRTRTISDQTDGTQAKLISAKYGVQTLQLDWWVQEIEIGTAHPSMVFIQTVKSAESLSDDRALTSRELAAIVQTIKEMEKANG
jgi:hypothetical protein